MKEFVAAMASGCEFSAHGGNLVRLAQRVEFWLLVVIVLTLTAAGARVVNVIEKMTEAASNMPG